MSLAPCLHPLALRLTRVHPLTGEVVVEQVERRCGTRLLDRCPSCSEIYRRDAMRVMFEGVAANPGPRTWITFTALGDEAFGRTHTASYKRLPSERCACRPYHSLTDSRVGEPLDRASYGYDKVASFNGSSSRLFAVTMQKIRRLLGGASLPYVLVVEYQRRGLVHIHVLVLGAVPRAIVELAVLGGRNPATGRPVRPTRHGEWSWGSQLDVQQLGGADTDRGRVIGYAVKDLAASAGEASASCKWSRATCRAGWTTSTIGIPVQVMGRTDRRCRVHGTAHRQWGFRGNVLAVNRSFGSTLTAVRTARRQWVAAQNPEREQWLIERIEFLGRAQRPAPAGRLDPERKAVTLQPPVALQGLSQGQGGPLVSCLRLLRSLLPLVWQTVIQQFHTDRYFAIVPAGSPIARKCSTSNAHQVGERRARLRCPAEQRSPEASAQLLCPQFRPREDRRTVHTGATQPRACRRSSTRVAVRVDANRVGVATLGRLRHGWPPCAWCVAAGPWGRADLHSRPTA
jgi:hypothetical protein